MGIKMDSRRNQQEFNKFQKGLKSFKEVSRGVKTAIKGKKNKDLMEGDTIRFQGWACKAEFKRDPRSIDQGGFIADSRGDANKFQQKTKKKPKRIQGRCEWCQGRDHLYP